MLLFEAKEILKKNGYRLVEEYDAVTDRNNIKNSRQPSTNSYVTNILKRIKLALAEEGIEAKLCGDRTQDWLKIGNYTLWLSTQDWESGYVDHDPRSVRKDNIGPESGENADFKTVETEVTLKLYSGMKHVDTADFDPRNTPSIVEWILDHIER